MNQLVAFLAPTSLPTAAGAPMRAQGAAAQGSTFATILAQVQNTIALDGAVATLDPTAQQQVSELLAQLPPGLVEAVKALSTDELAAQLQTVTETSQGGETQGIDALLALIAPATAATAAQPTNGEAPHVETSLGAVLQTFHQAAKATATEPAAAAPSQATETAPETSAEPQLRGTIAPEQTPRQQATKPADPATIAKVVENAPAMVPNTPARPRAEAPAQQQKKTTPETASPADKAKLAPPVQAAASSQTQELKPASKPAEAPVQETVPNNAQPPANPTAPAPPKLDIAQPQAPSIAPALTPPAQATLLDAQQMSVTLQAQPQPGVPVDALAVHIARKFEAGVGRFEIALHPAELGKLDISLSVADDGQVQAAVRVERPETLEILQRDARALEHQLRQAGLEVGSNALSFSLSGGNGQHRQAPFAGWPAFAEAQDAAATAKQDAAASYLAVRKSDGIDIRV